MTDNIDNAQGAFGRTQGASGRWVRATAAAVIALLALSGVAACAAWPAGTEHARHAATAKTQASDPQVVLNVTNTKLPVGEVAEDVMDRDADKGWTNAVVGCVDVADGADGYIAEEKVTERDEPEGGWTKPLIPCLDVAVREGFQNTAVEIKAWRGGQRSMILVAVRDGRAYELTLAAPKDAYHERVEYWREAVRAFTLR